MFFDIKKQQAQSSEKPPPNFGDIGISIPNCPEHRPSGKVFTIETTVIFRPNDGSPVILQSESALFSLQVDEGQLAWVFQKPSGEKNDQAIFSTRTRPLADGKRHVVQLVHGPEGCAFLVDEQPVRGFWAEKGDPAKILGLSEIWHVGGRPDVSHFFNGSIQNVRLFDGDVRLFQKIKEVEKRESAAQKMLLFDFSLEQFNPREGEPNSERLFSRVRPSVYCGSARIFLKPGIELLPALEKVEKPSGPAEKKLEHKNLHHALKLIGAIILAMVLLVVGVSLIKNIGLASDQKVLNAELPAALASVTDREEVFFIVRNSLPLPWWLLVKIGGAACVALYLFNEKWLEALEKAFSDDPTEQTRGVLMLILGIGMLAAFLAFSLWKDGYEVRALLNGRSYYIGLADRLLVAEPSRGLFRPIFWEQIREAELLADGANLKLTLRTLSLTPEMEMQTPETLFLNGFEGRGNRVFQLINERIRAAEMPKNSFESHINFGSREAEQYPKTNFHDLVAFERTVFAEKSPFGGRPFLMLRSRIEKVFLEPFDGEKSGWLAVARLKNGVRQPLAFFPDLTFARSAVNFLNR